MASSPKCKIYKFRELDSIELFLSGAVQGADISKWGSDIASGGGVLAAPPLVGLTLKTKGPGPAATCTFSSGADPGGRLLFKEIKAQVEAAISGVTVRTMEGRLCLVETTPASGVTVDKTGTANQALGFDVGNDTIGTFYNTPYGTAPTAPYIMFAYSVNDNMHVVYTFE